VGDQFAGIGQLRQQPGGHERSHFDLALPGRIGRVDPFELGGRGQHHRQALQAVAQAHFAQDDISCHVCSPLVFGVSGP